MWAQDCDGLLPLDYAVRNPHPKAREAVQILLEQCRDALKPEVRPEHALEDSRLVCCDATWQDSWSLKTRSA